jgi:hypothetical protein
MGQDDKLTEEQQLQAELDALRTANEPIHRREYLDSLRKQIAAEKLAARLVEVEAKVLEKLGGQAKRDIDYRFVIIDDNIVAVQRPHELHYKKYRDSEKTDMVSCLQFIRPSVVHPEKDEFVALCSAVPAMADAAAGAGLYLCGVRVKAKEGK